MRKMSMNSSQLESIIRVSIVKVRRLRGSSASSSPTTHSDDSTSFNNNNSSLRSQLKGISPLCLSDNNSRRSFVTSSSNDLPDPSGILQLNNSSYTISNLSGISTSNNNPVVEMNKTVRSRNNISLLRHLLITRIARKAKTELTAKSYLEKFPPSPEQILASLRNIPTVRQHIETGIKRMPNYSQDIIRHYIPDKIPCLYHDDRTVCHQNNNTSHSDYGIRMEQEYPLRLPVEVESSSFCLIKGVS